MFSRHILTSMGLAAVAALPLALLTPTAFAGDADAAVDETPEASADLTGSADADAPRQEIFERLHVVGSQSDLNQIPGSAQYLGAAELAEQNQGDIHRILRSVPGVNLQEEEGYGLRPNIGMRGTGVERSGRITLMEDGVLIAPAPYSAPSAYYFPSAGRMEGIEVRKGSSAIRQGPYTNGGVLNLLSTSIPSQLTLRGDLTVGEDELLKAHAFVGDRRQRYGWLIEGFRYESDGFKELDGGGSTGFELDDLVGKFQINSASDARVYQALELKLSKTDQLGQETYLGLSEADFELNPVRRYAGSQADEIDTDHEQVQLRYFAMPRSNVTVTTTAYRNDFFRNWFKLEKAGGVSVGSILAAPELYPDEFALIRGEVDDLSGALRLRNNRRDYYGQGVDTRVGLTFGNARISHDLEIGVRYHEDEEDRFQEEDRYGMVGGQIQLVALGQPGSNANRIAEADALAFYVQDRIALGRWTLSPGIRFESIDFFRRDFGKADPDRTGANLTTRENDVDVWIPGLGATYAVSSEWTVFGGIHKGFAPPGPGKDARTDPEESINYELGGRFSRNGFNANLTGFYNDYDNLLGTDTVSGGGTGSGDQFNGGEVEVFGLEASLRADLGERAGWRLSVPVRVAYTYTQAEFRNSFTTSFSEWAPEVQAGDELPYLPAHQWSLGLGVVDRRWGIHADLSFVDEMRTRPGQGAIAAGTGTEDALILDLSADVRLFKKLRLSGRVRNLTDEVYVAARRPAGLRPGLTRTAMLGISWGR